MPPQQVSSGVSQFANSRQKLSIQSLLLQSDFVDDSHDIAAASPEKTPQGQRSSNRQLAQGLHEGSLTPASRTSPLEVSNSDAWNGSPRNQMYSSSNGDYAPALCLHGDGEQQRGLSFNPWMGFPGTEDLLSGNMNDDY